MRRPTILLFLMTAFCSVSGFSQQAPYGGTPWPIPGRIEGEDYDTGGEGLAYHDADAGNNGGQYRSDDVDIETCGEGGYNVGWMDTDDWMEYTVNVTEAGRYTIRVRGASDVPDGGTFHVSFRDQNMTQTRTVPYTGGWQIYRWIDVPDVNLASGRQVMRLTVESSYFNVNFIEFVRMIDTQYPTVSIISPRDGDESESGAPLILKAQASDADGTVEKVVFFQNGISVAIDNQSPFETPWTPAMPGTYDLYAKATDDKGATTVSDTVRIRVLATKLPDGPEFSPPHGFYNAALDVTAECDSAGSAIRYTLDGSDPRMNASAFEARSPAVIRIDPASTSGRVATPAVVVRACAVRDGRPVTDVASSTYIFVERVKVQKYPGGAWPQGTDYDMDPDVVQDPRYKAKIAASLRDIPTMCISTDLGNLFDSRTGIYSNPTGRGREWERPASVELIDPNGLEEGFQANAGLRLRGGYSRIGGQPKHAFRLFFRDDYGQAKLNYPLFQGEGVSSFDCVDIKCAQNYSWSYTGSHANVVIRDVFSRDCQRDMGQPYTRSRAYHLYLNGVYWGLFETQERPEASFAESYFGSDKDNYDVVKVNIDRSQYEMEATDGNLDAFNALWGACQTGFSANAAYFKVQGKNPDGTGNFTYPVWVNPENLIDYLLVIYYIGNFDAPVSAFLGNYSPNNYYGIYDRIGRDGFRFFIHDAEHALMDPAYSENGDYGYDRTGPYPAGEQMQKFNPQWLHQKLSENAEYRMLFADRIYKHFFNKGALTLDAVLPRFQARADEIDQAIIVESARWGDSRVHPARTRDDDWLPSVEWIKNSFFPERGGIVLGQLADDNLYPSIDPPVYRNGSQDVTENVLVLAGGSKLRLVNTNTGSAGSIVYTLDGTDPRLIGGSMSGSAQDGGDDKELTISSNTVVKARVKYGKTWSALHEIFLNTGEEPSGLRLTEIHYNPLPDLTAAGMEYEFIELKNVGQSPLGLAGARFVNGIDYAFRDDASIPAGGFLVLASNSGMFRNRYGFGPSGEYEGQLDNAGERLTLAGASGDTLISVRYNDKSPWPEEADSAGYSLVSRNVNGEGDADTPEYWKASHSISGSPGMDDVASEAAGPVMRGPESFSLDQNYPNPFNPRTGIRFGVPRPSRVRLSVLDILGREAALLSDGRFEPGMHTVTWDASACPAGIYVVMMEAGGVRMTRKLTLVK